MTSPGMKNIILSSLMALLLVGATSCLGGDEDNVTIYHADMYNLICPLAPDQDPMFSQDEVSDFKVNFTRPSFDATIRTSCASVKYAFSTGELPMVVGTNSYVISTSHIDGKGCDITQFKALYDHRTDVIAIDYVVDNKYRVYSLSSFAYSFNSMKVQEEKDGKWEEVFSMNDVDAVLIPDAQKRTMTLKLINFRKSPKHLPVNVTYKSLPFTVSGHYLLSDKNYVVEYPDNHDYDMENLLISASMSKNTARINFFMEGLRYEMTCNMFSTAIK